MSRWKLRCPNCAETFVTADLDAPCPNCRWVPEPPESDVIEIKAPFLRTSGRTAQADKLYRDMEKGSEVRMQAAAEQLGVPVSEMSALKMTNMLDNRKPGENSVPPLPVNPVSEMMAANPQIGGFQGANGLGYSGAVQSGPAPNAGAKMRTALQDHHAQISHGSAVSDLPALETIQPGYRRRG